MSRSLLDGMTEEQQADACERIERFLREPLIEDLFDRLDKSAYNAFIAARTPTERESAHAKALALVEIKQGLKALVGAGIRARAALPPR